MKTITLPAIVSAIAVLIEKEGAVIDPGPFLPATVLVALGAPQEAHDALDGEFAAQLGVERGAPGWAHAVLDFLWDLFLR